MKRILESSEYVFNAASSQIDFSGVNFSGTFEPQYILGIINLDYNRGTLIYNPAGQNPTGGIWLSPFVLNLQFNTSLMNNTDRLLVVLDDAGYASQVNVANTIQAVATYAGSASTFSGMSVVGTNLLNNLTSSFLAQDDQQLLLQVTAGATITGGKFVIEGSNDGTNFVNCPYALLDEPQWQGIAGVPSTSLFYRNEPITVSANKVYMIAIPGYYRFLRARISSTITGGTLSSAVVWRPVDQQTCQPVMMADRSFVATGRSALNENLLNIFNSDPVDVSGFSQFMVRILGSAGITAGAIVPEQSNDGTTWMVPTYYSQTAGVFSSVRTIAASTEYFFQGPLYMRYFRIRISTAFTGGTVSMWCNLKQGQGVERSYVFGSETIAGVSLYNVGTTDASSAAITATTTTTPSSFNYQASGTFSVQVTAISGAGAFMDVSVEANHSSLGTSAWFRLYDFPRITTTGTFHSPPIKYGAFNQIRYVQTVGGTTPSVTRQIARRLIGNDPGLVLRSFIDRTILPNTLNSVTPVFLADGCSSFNLLVTMAGGGTPGAMQLEGSDDNVNWYSIGTPLTLVTGATVHNHPNQLHMVRWVRARVSTAGTGTTLGHVTIRASGD
jgi:hypothetical protein